MAPTSSHRIALGVSGLVLSILVGIIGCGPPRPPATPADFRQKMLSDGRGRVDTWTVDDGPAAVAGRLDQAFGACFHATIRNCQYGGYGSHCIVERHHHVAAQELDGSYTLTKLMKTNTRGGNMLRAEDGSVYQIVVDVKADGRGTSVTAYSYDSRYYDRFFSAIQGWSRALDGPPICPGLQASFSDLGRSGQGDSSEIRPAPPPPPPPE